MEITMRTLTTVVLAGAAIAGLTGLALAAGSVMHDMTVQMPGGGVAHIRYTGDVAPKVNFVQAAPIPVTVWGAPSPFAGMERISAMMDRQMAVMLTQARLMQQAADRPLQAAVLKDMPTGSSSYSFVSTMSGNDVCTRTTQITASPGNAPKVVSQTSGNCGDAPKAAPSVRQGGSPAAGSLNTISTKTSRTQAPVRRGI
jgi:hypothetical protein